MFLWPANAASSFLLALLFAESHIKSYCQANFDAFSYTLSGMTPVSAHPMGYAHTQPMYHMPEDKTEVIVVGEKGDNQQHHHHHHHHHKNIHHHHHGHQHSHGHNHNHDHKHDHGHNHDHNHNHKHDHNHHHKHAHGHKHHHNHGHGHQHNHGHLHGHKHAHILLHRHGHRPKHSPNHGPIYQQDHRSNNGQHHHNGKNFEQHLSNQQVNDHQQNQQHNIQEQKNYGSQHSNQFPSIAKQQYDEHISNSRQHDNLQYNNYHTKYPDHVSPSYVPTHNDNGISHNEFSKNALKEQNFKVHYDEPEKGNMQKSHYDHSASNENASYEPKPDDNHNEQDISSHSSENPPDILQEKSEEVVNKGVSSSEQDGASARFSNDNFNNMPLTLKRIKSSLLRKSYNSRFRDSNVPKDHEKAHQLKQQDQNSDELLVKPQVHYGVRLRQNSYSDYPEKEASVSAVTFLQENGEIFTAGNDDPFISVGKPLKLEDSNSHESYYDESLESKLSSGRMTLTPAQDYKASIGEIDELFNIPLFD